MMQKEYEGVGCITHVKEIIEELKGRKILLVTGKASFESSGAKSMLKPVLTGYDVSQFSDFSSNPQIEDIEKGVEFVKKHPYDIIIAVGGGSAIDIAKSLNILAMQDEAPRDYVIGSHTLKRKGKPLIAIPTTAGTGSEATHFAVVYSSGQKHSLVSAEFMLPDYVIMDPSLTTSLPPEITAATGMDALAQAIESYWSVRSTEESKEYARKAISLILTNLQQVVSHPQQESRTAMMKGANYAGKAINISFTTACHALSYPLTAHYKIPHGHAVGLTLAEMFLFNAGIGKDDCGDTRGERYVKRTMNELVDFFGMRTAEEVHRRLEDTMDSIGLRRKLSMLGIDTEAKREGIIKEVKSDRIKNNPRRLTEADIRDIMTKIM